MVADHTTNYDKENILNSNKNKSTSNQIGRKKSIKLRNSQDESSFIFPIDFINTADYNLNPEHHRSTLNSNKDYCEKLNCSINNDNKDMMSTSKLIAKLNNEELENLIMQETNLLVKNDKVPHIETTSDCNLKSSAETKGGEGNMNFHSNSDTESRNENTFNAIKDKMKSVTFLQSERSSSCTYDIPVIVNKESFEVSLGKNEKLESQSAKAQNKNSNIERCVAKVVVKSVKNSKSTNMNSKNRVDKKLMSNLKCKMVNARNMQNMGDNMSNSARIRSRPKPDSDENMVDTHSRQKTIKDKKGKVANLESSVKPRLSNYNLVKPRTNSPEKKKEIQPHVVSLMQNVLHNVEKQTQLLNELLQQTKTKPDSDFKGQTIHPYNSDLLQQLYQKLTGSKKKKFLKSLITESQDHCLEGQYLDNQNDRNIFSDSILNPQINNWLRDLPIKSDSLEICDKLDFRNDRRCYPDRPTCSQTVFQTCDSNPQAMLSPLKSSESLPNSDDIQSPQKQKFHFSDSSKESACKTSSKIHDIISRNRHASSSHIINMDNQPCFNSHGKEVPPKSTKSSPCRQQGRNSKEIVTENKEMRNFKLTTNAGEPIWKDYAVVPSTHRVVRSLPVRRAIPNENLAKRSVIPLYLQRPKSKVISNSTQKKSYLSNVLLH